MTRSTEQRPLLQSEDRRNSSSSTITSSLHDENSAKSEDEIWLEEERARQLKLPFYKRPSVYMISFTAFLFSFCDGVAYSARLQLTMAQICRTFEIGDPNREATCNENPLTQHKISTLIGAISMIGNAVATLMSGRVGSLSDQIGRQKVIAGRFALELVAKVCVISLLHPAITEQYHPVLLVAANCLPCLNGALPCFISLTNVYLSDVQEENGRIAQAGIINGCISVGMGLGPLVGALTISQFKSNWIPCGIDVCVSSFLVLFSCFVLPESRSKRAIKKSRDAYHEANGDETKETVYEHFLHLLEPLKILLVIEPGKRFKFYGILTISILFLLSSEYIGQVMILYPVYIFKWTAAEVGYFTTVLMASRSVMLLGISPWILKFLHRFYKTNNHDLDYVDVIIFRIGLIFESLGAFVMILANKSWIYRVAPIFGAPSSMLNPAIDTALIKFSPVDKVGQMMGAVSMVKNLLATILPPALLKIYSLTLEIDPRVAFYIMMAAPLVALVISLFTRAKAPSKSDDEIDDTDQGYGSTNTTA